MCIRDRHTPASNGTAAARASKAVAKKAPTTKKTTSSNTTTTVTRKKSKIDFTVIEGVGPKICQLLEKAGYKDFAALSKAKVGDLRNVLENAGSRYKMHDPSKWAQQARLASKDQWSKLNEFQAKLKQDK